MNGNGQNGHKAPYSEQFKAEVVEFYRVHGTAAAAERYGVAAKSVTNWKNELGVTTEVEAVTKAAVATAKAKRLLLREEVVGLFLEKTAAALGAIDFEKVKARDVQALATAAAIMADKHELLSGGVTSRHEVMTVESIDAELARLADELGRAHRTTEDAPTAEDR